MDIILSIVLFLLSLFLLIKGSDFLVDSAARIAKKAGVSDFIIGLTIIAIGTSLPELAVTITSSFAGQSDVVIGNIIGSNVADIALILGLSAIFVTVRVNKEVYSRDVLLMLASSILLMILAFNRTFSLIEGTFFLFLFAGYIIYFFVMEKRFKKQFHIGNYASELLEFKSIPGMKAKHLQEAQQILSGKPEQKIVSSIVQSLSSFFKIFALLTRDVKKIARFLLFQLLLFFVGLGMMIFGSDLLVKIVVSLPISPAFVAILAVAVGTSIPELMVSITSLRKGYPNIMIGNIIGSVIANTLLIIGIGAIISPIIFSTKLLLFCAFMVLINLVFVVFLRRGYKINRGEGIILLVFYLLFVALSVIYLI